MGKIVKSLSGTFKPRTTINAPPTVPAENVTRERGEYLARLEANCIGCHTPRDRMTFAPTGPEFSGCFDMEPRLVPCADPKIWFRAPNLTPPPRQFASQIPGSRDVHRGEAVASIPDLQCRGKLPRAHEHQRSRRAVRVL
jgi:hypothetical protein